MATIEDVQRKHAQFIDSQNNIVKKIASYGVGITNDTPFQQYDDMVEETVSTKLAGILDGTTEFTLDERDFKKITYIRKYASYRSNSLKRVVIPNFVISIGDYAFGTCIALTEVILKGKIAIGTGAFNGCKALTKVYLPAATSLSEVSNLVNISAFTGINEECVFYVPNEASLAIYEQATNWCDLYENYTFTIGEAE